VALTQLLVETLTVIIVSIILLRLPGLRRSIAKTRFRKAADGLLAAGMGVFVSILMLSGLAAPLDLTITNYYEHNSYVAAHGKNIVNVILVDFRSMDTLGEIIVVATAGLAGYALIRRRKGDNDS
jgi:multicomponent Na+:H+ antiporter subunit A